MYITNAVVLIDDVDDQTYSRNVDALSGLLRETGAAHEDAAYSFIETANKSRATSHTPSALAIEGSGPQERITVLSPEFVLETHLMLFIARDELSAARRLALKMEGCSWLSSKVKMDAWGRILSHLRQIGMLLLDGNHATPCYERKFQDLTILVMSMGQPLGVDVLCNFFHDFASEVSRNDAATEEEKTYVTLAAQRTLLLLLRNRYSNDEKAVKEWLDVFPNLSYFGSSAVDWAEGFVQRKNLIPPSLLVDGFVDLNAFRTRAIKSRILAPIEALEIQEESKEHLRRMRADEEVCVVDDEEGQDVDEVCVVDDEEEQDVAEVFVVDDEEEHDADEVIDIVDNDSDVVEDMEDVESEVDEDDTEELDQAEGVMYGTGEEESHEGNDEDAETEETHGRSRVWTDESKRLRVSGDQRLGEKEADEVEGREPSGRARYDDDYDFDGEMGPGESDDGSDVRENEGTIEEEESASDNHDVVEILDDSDDDEMLEESESFREEQLESDDDAQDADVEHLDDDSDDEARDADAERLNADSDAQDDGDTPDVGLDTSDIQPDMQPASAHAESLEIEDAEHNEGTVLSDLQPRKNQSYAEDRLDPGYEPDSAGGDTSQAETHSRLEKGYEPDSASQHDDQEETPCKEMWRGANEEAARLEMGYEPDTAAGGDISHAEMQDRLEKGYEPDAGSQVDDQEDDVLEEVQRARKLREAQARLEQGYEPDTAGGDISQAEMQDRLEQGYEPDTTAVYTEEEVSEAAQSEDDDNALDEPSREHDSKIDAVSTAQKPTPDQLGALSDDMDAADDRTEVDHGAELSEVEESMSQACEAADHGVSSSLEASSTLLAFAYEAQNRPTDINEELATDLRRNKIDAAYSLLASRMSPAGRTSEAVRMTSSVDGTLDAEIAFGLTPGNDATHPESESAKDGFVQAEHQVSNDLAPEPSVDPLERGHFNHLPGLHHLRPPPPERSLSTIVHLSASEMSDDGGVDEPAKIQEEDVYDEAESDYDPKHSDILPALDPAPKYAALTGEEGEDRESEVDAKSRCIPPPVERSPKRASDTCEKGEEPVEEYDAHVPDIRPSREPSKHAFKAVEEGDDEPDRGLQANTQRREVHSPECAVDVGAEGEGPHNEVCATVLDSQIPSRPTPRRTSEASEKGQESDNGVNLNSKNLKEPLQSGVETLEEGVEPDGIACATPTISQHSVARGQKERPGIPPTSVEGGDGALSSAIAVDVKVQLTRNGRSRMNPSPAENGEEGDYPENEGDTKETQALVSLGRKGKSRILSAPTENKEERSKPSIDIDASPEEVKPPEAAGRKRRPKTQLEAERDVATADAVSIPRRETRSTTKTVVEVVRQDKPEKRGRQPVKEEESHVAQPKQARGEDDKSGTEIEILREENEPILRQAKPKPKKRGRQPVMEEESHVAQPKRARGEDDKSGAETEILKEENEPIVRQAKPKKRGRQPVKEEESHVVQPKHARGRKPVKEEESHVAQPKPARGEDETSGAETEFLTLENEPSARKDKPKKRGRLPVKEEESHVAQPKQARGEDEKSGTETEILKEENEPILRQAKPKPKKRGRQPVKEEESHVAQPKRARGEDDESGAETEFLKEENEPILRQGKPKKRGRLPVKEEESHFAQPKQARGEGDKGGAESEVLSEESEPIVDEPKRRGGKYSVRNSTEAAPVTSRRSARARVATVEEEVPDGKGEAKSLGRQTRRQSETNLDERKPRKRGRLAVEDTDQDTAVIPNKKLSRGRQSKASSEPDVNEKHENQPQARTTRGSGKKARDASPASMRQSADVRNTKNGGDEEGVQKAGAQRRNTRGVKKEKGSVPLNSEAGRSDTGATGTDSLQLAKEEGGELQSRKARVPRKKSPVAPVEETVVPTRRSARGRKPNNKY
ncbi:hypothetical protein MHU86_21177 [Fragilaria crotonensis]|nr:hypothetical protein MHU86_21177 [Fragilaria crotonensis]